ncbi:MAG TPA: LysR substrate-binding domain-containing protein [Chthoniobacterales bacterium]|jgi:DNA-binding transcriptional LysR family regulator|nr:LysR substrate-binding domain-containing protein [Chthoniobacterales bacterium]
MELRHLRYFVAVAEELSFSKAARRLHIAQPPLSMQIRLLEETLGVPLFDRSQRPVALTPAGTAFLKDARKILSDIEAAQVRVRDTGGGEAGSLKVAFITPLASELLADIIRAFRARYPKVAVTLAEMPSSLQATALQRGEIDIGFLRRMPGVEVFVHEPVCQNRFMLAVPAKHPLRRRNPLRWQDLKDVPLILLDLQVASGFYDGFLQKCGRANLRPGEFQTASDMHTAFWMASAGFGVAPTIDFMRAETRGNLAFVDLPEDTPVVDVLMARAPGNSNPAIEKFFEVAAAALKKDV